MRRMQVATWRRYEEPEQDCDLCGKKAVLDFNDGLSVCPECWEEA